jgi:hypothetical protein
MAIKHIAQRVLTYLAVIYLAMIAFLNLNLHGGRITESTENLNSLILITLFIAVGIRFLKKSRLTTILIIGADIILMALTVETVVTGGLWETLKNIIIEPGITLVIICMAVLLWDWVIRTGKKLQTGNKT